MKIFLAVPTNRGLQSETLQCLMELVAQSKHDIEVICPSEGYTVAENRNYIAVQAYKSGAEYLLMIDDDMTFPPETLDRLLSNKKEICGVPYHSRGGFEGKIMAVAEPKKGEFIDLKENDKEEYKKLFSVHAVGTGIILIKCDIFPKIKQPWFDFEQHENGCTKNGEDWYFCEKAKKHNIKTYIDPTLEIGHIGDVIF